MDALFASEEVTGEVIGVYVRKPTGFGVVEVMPEVGDGVVCTGPLAELVEGQVVRLVGQWNDHPKYGQRFEATFYEQLVPTSVPGLRTFLRSQRFHEVVDEDTVERLLAVFAVATGRVIEHEPQRLASEAGLAPDVADELHRRWRAGLALSALVRLVEPARIPFDIVRAAHSQLGTEAAAIVAEDPYRLLEVERCRFAHADALASHLGVDPLDARRLAAGARASVAAAQRHEGHQYLTRTQCVAAAARLLAVDEAAAGAGLDRALAEGSLAVDEATGSDAGAHVVAVYTSAGLRTERNLAEDLVRLATTARSRLAHLAAGLRPGADLTPGQAEAVRLAFHAPVALLTGGPGTGKTRTVQEVVAAAAGEGGLNVALCAPTGRAAKRLEELVGHPATTIHRLLEARHRQGLGFAFRYGRDERLPFDLVVCDEVSMCDTALAWRLAAAVDDGAHLLLVGDADQLPSVGPGDVLRDVARSGVVPRVDLTEIHRQAAGSRIVGLAREINRGEVGRIAAADGDVFLAEEVADRIAARVVEAVARRAPAHLGVDPGDVQVIAPVYRGPAGVDALNRALKAALNPAQGQPAVAGFQSGDRVMQTRNDADLDVSNGDVGTVLDVDVSTARLRVAFPRGEVVYDAGRARDLALAWAITVHKSQGGEWPVIVFVCDRSHRGMLWRNLAYTAVTRAQQALVVVGQADALRAAARQDRPRNRQTMLAARLVDLAGLAQRSATEVPA